MSSEVASPAVPESTRTRIVAVADKLFYEQGFEATSFADIAKLAGLSRGNFYYHFKTKDEILSAVIAHRSEVTSAMLDAWEDEGSLPADRLMSFAHILVANRPQIMAHGCPVGTLCNELAKHNHDALADASAIFALFREWLVKQFVALGYAANADAYAMHLLMRCQGVAALATAFREESFVDRELDSIQQWIASLTQPTANGDMPCLSSS